MSLQEATRLAHPSEFRASGADVARLAPGCVRACRPVRGRLRRVRAFGLGAKRAFGLGAKRAFALAAMRAFVLVALFATAALT